MNYPCRSKEGYERRVAENTNTAMQTILLISTQALLVILLAEFAAGMVHWFEDAYIREDTPLLGNLVGRPNVIHHHLPRHMTRNNWWQSSWDLLLVSAIIVLIAWALGRLTWHVWLFAAISTNANEFHKWAHRTRRENGRIISFLQGIRLLQTPQHHALHHTNPKNVRYCVVTNALNPVLDRVRFWEALEWLLARTIGLHRRPDTSLPEHGPMPAWLNEFRQHAAQGRIKACSWTEVGMHIISGWLRRINPSRWLKGDASRCVILSMCLLFHTGCRATRHVVQMSQPHTQPRAHAVVQIHEAAQTADGRLLLHANGRMAGSSAPMALTIALPPLDRSTGAAVQRIVVPATTVRAAGPAEAQGMNLQRRVPVGPPIIFARGDTYNWDLLRPSAGRGQEIRLVRRLGEVERWEVLHLEARAGGDCRFTVFEARSTQVTVRHRSALALVPLAMASDVVAVGTMTAAPAVYAGGCLSAVAFGSPLVGLYGLSLIDELEPVKQLTGR